MSASAIAFASFRQWKTLGVGPMLEPHAQRIEQILVTDGRTPGAAAGPGGAAFLRFDSHEIADRSDGEPLGYMLENRRIRAGLAEAVKATPSIRVLAPARVASMTRDPARATVTLDDGRTFACALVRSATSVSFLGLAFAIMLEIRFVIPGRSEGPNPESRDSRFALNAPGNDWLVGAIDGNHGLLRLYLSKPA